MNIINILHPLPNEKEEQFIWRIGQAKDAGTLDMSWDEISDVINRTFRVDEMEYRSEAAYRKPYQQAKRFFESGVFNNLDEENYCKELQNKKRELLKERKKLSTEKIEYNKWLREEARDELIMEKICDAISNLPNIDIPQYISSNPSHKSYVLCFGDEHYGVEYELYGLFGETINAYSPEIFESRMWDLFNQTVEIIQKENVTELNVFSFGDFQDGILRVGQLMKLRYGVVDGTIKYADFIAQWLNKLSEYVHINYQQTNGNHTELRMLGQQKGTFDNDNMGKVLSEFIKIRLQDNPNFTYIENPTGYIYAHLSDYTFLGIHGEVKNMAKTIGDFSKIYNVPIDYLCAGHLHHAKAEEVGINSEVINIPSIIGIDKHSLSLHKTANAAAKFLIFESNKGKICEYTLKLN